GGPPPPPAEQAVRATAASAPSPNDRPMRRVDPTMRSVLSSLPAIICAGPAFGVRHRRTLGSAAGCGLPAPSLAPPLDSPGGVAKQPHRPIGTPLRPGRPLLDGQPQR